VKHLVLSALVVLGSLGVAQAQDNQVYECRRGDDVRRVAVEPSGTKGCSVFYKKSAAASAQRLWQYEAHPEMCAEQAQQFLKKLEGMGLSCAAAKP
jgi:hypothetical protein